MTARAAMAVWLVVPFMAVFAACASDSPASTETPDADTAAPETVEQFIAALSTAGTRDGELLHTLATATSELPGKPTEPLYTIESWTDFAAPGGRVEFR